MSETTNTATESTHTDERTPVDHVDQTPESGPSADMDEQFTEEQVVAVLRTIYDPEIPVNIYDLGLIYDIRIEPNRVYVLMTLTAPNCPVAGTFPGTVENKIREYLGVDDVEVELTFDPPFTMERMSEEVRLQLGLL